MIWTGLGQDMFRICTGLVHAGLETGFGKDLDRTWDNTVRGKDLDKPWSGWTGHGQDRTWTGHSFSHI